MAGFFSGWIGYGAGVQAGVLQEPADSAYARRQIQFSVLENGLTFDMSSGTVGPSSVAWGALNYSGLFDAQIGGNLLVVCPMLFPVSIGVGATYTTGPASNVIFGRDLRGGSGTQTFPAGTVIGATPDGRAFVANLPLQICAGVLSAQSPTFGTTVTMATLPSAAPAAGSGRLWNNGGVIAVA